MRLLLTGASGQLGAYLLRELAQGQHDVTAWSGTGSSSLFGFPLQPVWLESRDAMARAIRQARPDAILHTAALASVARCLEDPTAARLVNVQGTQFLTELAGAKNARLILVSTDLVFDGERGNYRETDPPAPLSVYGKTKREAEQVVLARPGHAVVRLSLLFGPTLTGRPSFFDTQWAALQSGKPLALFEDEWRTPLSLARAARALIAVAESDFTGLIHIGGPERMSRLEMGQRLAKFLHLDPAPIVACRREASPVPEPRPRDTSLNASLWRSLFPQQPWPTWEEALKELQLR
jgi:dTDP-4-dehydrorhamnose reductase